MTLADFGLAREDGSGISDCQGLGEVLYELVCGQCLYNPDSGLSSIQLDSLSNKSTHPDCVGTA